MFKLDGKKILITGASNGIGSATAEMTAKLGAQLIITGRNKERLLKVLEKLEGTGHTFFVGDLTDNEDLESLVDQIDSLDGVVHSAGIVKLLPIQFLTREKIEEVAGINFYVPVELNRLLFKKKKINKGASLVFISSISSQFPYKGGAVYNSFKAALETYSKCIALEMSHKKIRSNCIKAGMVRTNILDEALNIASRKIIEEHREKYPLGFGEPSEVASAVVFLLSEASKWITGTEIVLDGGLTISRQ